MNLRNNENVLKISPLSTKERNYHHSWLRNREMGGKPSTVKVNRLNRELYSTIRPISRWDSSMSTKVAAPGGIFNLEFSPDGSLMVAACEKRSILLFDPNSQKCIQSVVDAHEDCVNCVRFLDSRMFATCSDDRTVALWDTRNLKTKIRVLKGHGNWVKNVEYSKKDNLLVTSGFDGHICTWDINKDYSHTDRDLLYKRAFHTNGLMRMKLSPDANKMVICTTAGYMMVIHDLNLKMLPSDLCGFKPNLYRLMQISETTIPVAAKFTPLFSQRRKRNRMEFVADFPRGDDAEVISSLQIHPHGWCVISRNITTDEHSEWTCVHDIQDDILANESECSSDCDTDDDIRHTSPPTTNVKETLEDGLNSQLTGSSSASNSQNSDNVRNRHDYEAENVDDIDSVPPSDIWEALMSIHVSRDRPNVLVNIPPFIGNRSNSVRIVRVSSGIDEQFLFEEEANSSDGPPANASSASPPSHEPPSDERRTAAAGHSLSNDAVAESSGGGGGGGDDDDDDDDDVAGGSGYGGRRASPSRRVPPLRRDTQTIIIVGPRNINSSLRRMAMGGNNRMAEAAAATSDHRIQQNRPRLTHYIEETNAGKGFIKELGFSQDGRVICSPFSYGIRLLAFDECCSELSSCVPAATPVKLHEIGTSTAHQDIVLCTKFSPRHCMLVSGCHSGHVVWYQPVF